MSTQLVERNSVFTGQHPIEALSAIQQITLEVIESLPGRPLDELLELRKKTSEVGHCAWYLECAIDAELLNQLGVKRGRGNKDTGELGLTAVARQRAEKMGLTISTLFDNARIVNIFFADNPGRPENILVARKNLLDKTFFSLAARSDNPLQTLEIFIEAKERDPRFSTREARKIVQRQSAPDLSLIVECALDNAEAREAWAAVKRDLRWLSNTAPQSRGKVGEVVEELEYHLSLPAESLLVRLLAEIELAGDGGITVEDLSKLINYHRDVTRVLIRRMQDDEYLIENFRKSEYSKTADQRGTYLYALSARGRQILKKAGRSAFA